MDRFYTTAAEILIDHEAIAIFVPAMTEGNHAGQAIDAGLELLRATGHDAEAPWAPVGIGINTGRAFVGAVGTAEHVEFTALGDTVNVTARLSSEAAAGEILVAESSVRAAGLAESERFSRLARRRMDLRGRSEATGVLVLTLAAGTDLEALAR